MKIGIDAISAVGQSGNGTYTRELVKSLEKIDDKNNYYLFSFLHDFGKKTLLTFSGRSKWQEVHMYLSKMLLPIDRIDVVNDYLLRMAARMRGIEILHFTNPLNFVGGKYRSVVTVHDLSPFYDATWSKGSLQQTFTIKMQKIAREANAIIAVSEFTKKDLIERLHADASKITVIYEAASDFYHKDLDPDTINQKFGTAKYILYAGQLQPRKNALTLVQAWASLAKRYPEHKLILVGHIRDAAYLKAIKDAAQKENAEDSVVIAGQVDDILLRKLYSSARCFVYPSFFEGFGLPILEALQCGTPVITSNTSSLPEVAGEAGLFVDPHSVEAIAAAIDTMITNDEKWSELKQKAQAQAAKFSWKKAAEETLQVYEQLYKR